MTTPVRRPDHDNQRCPTCGWAASAHRPLAGPDIDVIAEATQLLAIRNVYEPGVRCIPSPDDVSDEMRDRWREEAIALHRAGLLADPAVAAGVVQLLAAEQRAAKLEEILQRSETGHVTFRGGLGQELHPDWCRECRVDAARNATIPPSLAATVAYLAYEAWIDGRRTEPWSVYTQRVPDGALRWTKVARAVLQGAKTAATTLRWTNAEDVEPPIGTRVVDALGTGLEQFEDGWHPIGCAQNGCRGIQWPDMRFPLTPWQPCGRCGTAGVARPNETGAHGKFCAECIDRCHESAELGHACAVCAAPEVVSQRVTPPYSGDFTPGERIQVAGVLGTVLPPADRVRIQPDGQAAVIEVERVFVRRAEPRRYRYPVGGLPVCCVDGCRCGQPQPQDSDQPVSGYDLPKCANCDCCGDNCPTSGCPDSCPCKPKDV